MAMKKAPVSAAPANALIEFLNKSRSPYHAVKTSKEMLTAAGYVKLSEKEDWTEKVKPNGKYFLTRNQSALIAFAVGGNFRPGNGFNIVAAHTDSPCLKIKPVSKSSKEGYMQVGVECYGGGLWHTWFDRDLALAGRVIVREAASEANGGQEKFVSRLVNVDRPLLRIPTLAIHLDRGVNESGFKLNKQTHLLPVLCTAVQEELNATPADVSDGCHHPALLRVLAEELKCAAADIHDMEIFLCDAAPAVIGGLHREFVFSGRLDNLAMSSACLQAMLEPENQASLATEPGVRVIALFDNEEVGSSSSMGAGSTLLQELITRVSGAAHVPASLASSFLLSADMAHAVHPNYPERHEENHRPRLHEGVVIKTNGNQRYATTSSSAFLLRQIARRCGVPMQDFCVRNDSGCGSTIGPILSTQLGMRTIDIGTPQLSMHSIREMCGTDDVAHSVALFSAFFQHFAEVDASLSEEE